MNQRNQNHTYINDIYNSDFKGIIRVDSSDKLTHSEDVIKALAPISENSQWVMFTSQCPRPDTKLLDRYQVQSGKIIHLKNSKVLSEIETVIKAIESNNASAIVASNNIDFVSQKLLVDYGKVHHCDVFFVEGRTSQFH